MLWDALDMASETLLLLLTVVGLAVSVCVGAFERSAYVALRLALYYS